MEVKRTKNENIIDYTINFKFTCNSSNESLKKVFRGEPSEFHISPTLRMLCHYLSPTPFYVYYIPNDALNNS